MDQKDCKDCGSSVNVKKSGELWRHKNPEGSWCASSTGTNHVVEAAPMVFDATTTVDKKPTLSVDVAGVDTPKRDNSPKKTAPKKAEPFSFVIEVLEPCEYLGDENWENSNKALAYKQAKDSGKEPSGEPRLAKSEVVGRKRVLTYEVPVE